MPVEIFQYFLIIVIIFAVIQIIVTRADMKITKEYNDEMNALTDKLWKKTAEINAKRKQEANDASD